MRNGKSFALPYDLLFFRGFTLYQHFVARGLDSVQVMFRLIHGSSSSSMEQ